MSTKDNTSMTTTGGGAIHGSINLDPSVVATIAAMAAQSIHGIHSVGKTPLISLGSGRGRGVATEIGEKQVAIDLDVVLEYGHDLRQVVGALREQMVGDISKMTGREVVELNVHVIDIKLPEDEPKPKKSRVV